MSPKTATAKKPAAPRDTGEHEELISGSEAIAVTRKCYGEHVSAVVVTGETDPDVVRSITACGLRVMHKPVQLDELQICLHELSAARQADAA